MFIYFCKRSLYIALLIFAQANIWAKGMSIDDVDAQVADTEPFDNEDEYVDPTELKDPLEPVNRFVFGVNDRLDGTVIRPVSQVYQDLTPEPIRKSVTNFMDNVWFPVNFANFILQGRMEKAGISLFRFLLNTTMGVGGVLDPAAEFGLEKENTGLGDTLGSWGMEPGPYLMLPLFGPSTFRHALGFAADQRFHPLSLWVRNTHAHKNMNKHRQWWHWYVGKQALEFISTRADLLDTLDGLKKNSLDYYTAIRSLYGQKIHATQEQIQADREKIMHDHDDEGSAKLKTAPDQATNPPAPSDDKVIA